MAMRILALSCVLVAFWLPAEAADSNRVVSPTDAKRVSVVTPPAATQRFYHANGSAAGRSQTSGATTHFYQANGQSAGRAQQSGKTVYFYDAAGRAVGRAQQSGNTTYCYDASGRSTGRAATAGSTTIDLTPTLAAGQPVTWTCKGSPAKYVPANCR